MSDDLHERRITGMDWPRATRHLEARLDDLLEKLTAASEFAEGLGAAVAGLAEEKNELVERIAALEGE